jgi:hypothetical protein
LGATKLVRGHECRRTGGILSEDRVTTVHSALYYHGWWGCAPGSCVVTLPLNAVAVQPVPGALGFHAGMAVHLAWRLLACAGRGAPVDEAGAGDVACAWAAKLHTLTNGGAAATYATEYLFPVAWRVVERLQGDPGVDVPAELTAALLAAHELICGLLPNGPLLADLPAAKARNVVDAAFAERQRRRQQQQRLLPARVAGSPSPSSCGSWCGVGLGPVSTHLAWEGLGHFAGCIRRPRAPTAALAERVHALAADLTAVRECLACWGAGPGAWVWLGGVHLLWGVYGPGPVRSVSSLA